LLRKPVFGLQKRRKQPERYAKFFLPKFVVAGAIHGA
jgi:hypothetical protein